MCTPVTVTITSASSMLASIMPQIVAGIALAVGAIITFTARPLKTVRKQVSVAAKVK